MRRLPASRCRTACDDRTEPRGTDRVPYPVSLIVDEHREYLSDSTRLTVFRRAIRECVPPGAVVADIGSGTGILGLLACEAGAARVYSIEATGMIEIAA